MLHFSNLVFVSATVLAVLAGKIAGAAIEPQSDDKLTVRIDGLGSIRGKTVRTEEDILGFRRDYLSFSGIPYGTNPPRFSPAQMRVPLTSGDDVFDATQPQVACWQALAPPLVPGPFSEDCLSLNIYTPKLPTGNSAGLPVIFFIHGGSFVRWSGNLYDGRRLLNKDVVVVTINYRLNIFGFFCSENDLAPGNLGLYDQLLALQWVNKYISAFGGDPNRITIAGQSAGGASVTYLLDSPLANGLFQGAIAASGDDLAGWAIQAQPLTNSLTAATVMGCYNPNATTHNLELTLNCLRAIPPSVLVQANAVFYSAPSVQSFNLSIPKITPVSPYVSLVTTGTQSKVPLMIGTNKNDGSLMLSRTYSTFLQPSGLLNNIEYMKNQFVADLLRSTSFGMTDTPLGMLDTVINTYLGKSKNTGVFHDIAPGLVDIYSAFYFKSSAFATAKAHSKGTDTYLYSFDYEGPQTLYPAVGGVPQVPKGATHIDDLLYLFYFGAFPGPLDKLISSQMVNYWTNFATTYNPNGRHSSSWPKFTIDGGKFYKINTIPTVGTDYVNYWVGASKW